MTAKTKVEKIELLAPAGNMDCLKAAVENGADSVYLGMMQFNARESAGNFSREELKKAIDYCHENAVKVYVTFNTLVKDNEIEKWLDEINYAYSAGCDAIIIQEYWLLPLINKNFPDLDVHLSTQCFVMNAHSINYIRKIGKFSRVILARELSLEEIRQIKKNTYEDGSNKDGSNVDIEIFVHGALCMCYSGQCLFSSIIGGRSGNRGKCAQPCRKMYNEEYLLSTKDLCLIEHIPEIINSGIKALKIEGRMRSPLYTAIVVRNYRKAMDAAISGKKYILSDETIRELELGFNREFSDDYFSAKNPENVVGKEKPMNRGIFLGEYKDNVVLNCDIEIGDGYCIWDDKNTGGVIKKIVDSNGKSVSSAKKGEKVNLNFRLYDSRKIYLTSCRSIEKRYSVVDQEIVETINKRKKIEYNRKNKEIIIPKLQKAKCKEEAMFIVNVNTVDEAKSIAECKNENVCISCDVNNARIKEIKEASGSCKLFVKTSKIANDNKIQEDVEKVHSIKPKGVIVSNIGYLNMLEGRYEIVLDYNMNIFNSFSLNELRQRGMTAVMSAELNFDDLTQIKDKNYYVFIHGYIAIATTKLPIKDEILIDEINAEFKAKNSGDYSEIYNTKEIGFFEHVKKLHDNGIKNYYISSTKKPGEMIKAYIEMLRGNAYRYNKNDFTLGHLKRGV